MGALGQVAQNPEIRPKALRECQVTAINEIIDRYESEYLPA
jgi:hypothetical protein